MGRPLRLHVPGGFYHVTLRGNHRQAVFFSDQDRDLLDCIVGDVISDLAARVHAYCWMTNHIHLLVQISDAPLGGIILRIASKYARKVQGAIATTGHLFERRYHAVLVDADQYLLPLVRYIHFNPVRAGIVTEPSNYRWSSHCVYLRQRQQSWVTTDFLMAMFAADRGEDALSRYRQWMGHPEPDRWGTGILAPNRENSQVLGDDEFVSRFSAFRWKPRSRTTLEELVNECCARYHLSPDALASRCRARQLATARAWLAHEAVEGRVASVSAVARRLGRSETAIRKLMLRRPRIGQ